MKLLETEIPKRMKDRQIWGMLPESASSLAIAESACQENRLILVVAQNNTEASQIEAEVNFFLTNPEVKVLALPDWETLPYDNFSPHQDIISQRLSTLYQLPQMDRGVLVVSVSTLMHRLPPVDYLQQNSLMVNVGESLDLKAKRKQLIDSGYILVNTVYEHGEFAIRGSIVDIYPMGAEEPFRLDLLDDEIDTIRTFDPETQRSIEKVKSICLLPAKEFPLTDSAVKYFKQKFRETFAVDYRKCPIYEDISSGIAPGGIEYYLHLFFAQTALLFDYLPQSALVFTQSSLVDAVEQFWQEVNAQYENHCVDPERPILKPEWVFAVQSELFTRLKTFQRIRLESKAQELKAGSINFNSDVLPSFSAKKQSENPLVLLQNFIQTHQEQIIFCAESAGRQEILLEMLGEIKINPQKVDSWKQALEAKNHHLIVVASIDRGLYLPDKKLLVLCEDQLFGQRVQQRRRRNKPHEDMDQIVRNLTELRIGAPIVHIEHGVGRYCGLTLLSMDGHPAEFLTLEYAQEAKLYVPVANLHLISRYGGNDQSLAPLHRLGNEQWVKAKRKAAEKAFDVATELLDIYARRQSKKGLACTAPDADYDRFCASFPFEETPDQASAIEAVIEDMVAPRPMDRLVCGDVGFGKTEVAMRAAFLAVQGGKQVAVLVPTTLLAQQHYDSFRDRFANWPFKIEVMSRFKTSKQNEKIQEQLENGLVDIIIGTHKLLQSSVRFSNLGLTIIDEEHRFGVKQKEQFKSLRAEVDILALTATPIPRTLNMAMSQIRDLSIIATPPAKRLTVRTFVRQDNKALIKEAILRELLRGGQVYYLHNEVKTIDTKAQKLQELIPEARIGVGHGKLKERDLEKVMSDFYHRRFNLLVCTTIIETGIDIPSANTIIIDRADKFGLAQLHQLRGRVGRSHHQAYAYLLSPPKKQITEDARKRLDAIANTQELGAGFTLATHDLEIRGAGELLGDEQSGQIQNIGISLYTEMLDRAVESIRKGEIPSLEDAENKGAEINLRVCALIPDDYLPDVHNRLILYKRIANTKTEEELIGLKIEMIDRFGPLPDGVKSLLRVTQIKQTCTALGICKIDAGSHKGRIDFSPKTSIEPLILVKLIQTEPHIYKLEGSRVLRYEALMDTDEQRMQFAEKLLAKFAPRVIKKGKKE